VIESYDSYEVKSNYLTKKKMELGSLLVLIVISDYVISVCKDNDQQIKAKVFFGWLAIQKSRFCFDHVNRLFVLIHI